MAGHSKWNNIKRRKGAADEAKGKLFTKLGKEIQVAVKAGGSDPENNAALSDAIARAKSNNMPNDSIKRSIEKAASAGEGDDYFEITYEGYGPEGIAVMVRALSNNRNRTAGEVRHVFDKYGGNLGTNGCVAFLFERKGYFVVDKDEFDDEDKVMMDALEAGADDITSDDEFYEIITQPEDYHDFHANMEKAGYKFADMRLGPVALNYNKITDEENVEKMNKLLEALDDVEDVQDVYHNWESDE